THWLYVSAVAAAIAIVSVSIVLARSGSDTDSDNTPSQNPSSATTPTNANALQPNPAPTTPNPSASTGVPNGTSTPQGANAKLPTEYVGTWAGNITSQAGVTSSFRITLHPADAQGLVASTVVHAGGELVQGDCTSDSKLTSVGGDGIRLQDVPNNKPQPTFMGTQVCAFGGEISLRLDKPGGTTMKVEVLNTASGNPTGTLTKS
ncbi:MAG: hypothetical protein HOV68_29665, partial [Streptomycetaceae bacterium]|nr:hypothetical protein [Streptomycetaceae bacterium]